MISWSQTYVFLKFNLSFNLNHIVVVYYDANHATVLCQ